MSTKPKRSNNTQRRKILDALGGKAKDEVLAEGIDEIECSFMRRTEYSQVLPDWNTTAQKSGRYHGSRFWSVKGFGVNRWPVVARIQVDWEGLLEKGMTELDIFKGCVAYLNKIPPRKKFQRRQRRKPYGTLSYEPVQQLSFKKDAKGTPFIEAIMMTDQRRNRNFWGEGVKL